MPSFNSSPSIDNCLGVLLGGIHGSHGADSPVLSREEQITKGLFT